MKEINLKYLDENFLSLEELSAQTGISADKIKVYIEEQLLPQPSYKLRKIFTITSPLDDEHKIDGETLYFPKSYLSLLNNLEKQNSQEIKENFINQMRQHLLNHNSKDLAYENAVSDENRIEKELENEWDYYQKGIYGICTLNASPSELIEKEIAVKKLLRFLDKFSEDKWEHKKSELLQIIAEYDEVSNVFAPYQRESSSRGKYVDKALQKLGIEDKIKTY